MKRLISCAGSLLLLFLWSCGDSPQPEIADHRLLQDRFQIEHDLTSPDSPSTLDLKAPQMVTRGNSRRDSLVTLQWQSWLSEPLENSGGVIEFSLAAVPTGESGSQAMAILELEQPGGKKRQLFAKKITVETDWVRCRAPLPASRMSGARIRLKSDGAVPVAWSEIQLLAGQGSGQPNVILLLLDTLGADHLSGYGEPRRTSPHLDRLGRDAWWFTDALSASSWTLPSMASLFSGLLPVQHGAVTRQQQLSAEVVTIAEQLRGAGYLTAAVTDGGFAGHGWGLEQGFCRYDVTPGKPWAEKDAETIFEAAGQWVRENRFAPFFLVVHTYETHQPYSNSERFADEYLDPDHRGRWERLARIDPRRVGEVTAAELGQLLGLYHGEVRRADHYLARFLAHLRKEGLYDSAALIITSDHGEEFMEHGSLEHGFGKVFDANVRVPLIYKPPGNSVSGAVCQWPVSGIDLAPTLLQLAGLPATPLHTGRSFSDSAAHRPVAVQGYHSFSEERRGEWRLDHDGAAVILDRVSETVRWYDRARDPGMSRRLEDPFTGKANQAAHLLQALEAWSGPGTLITRLPAGVERLKVEAGESRTPVGYWADFIWNKVSSESPGGEGLHFPTRAHAVYLAYDGVAENEPEVNDWKTVVELPPLSLFQGARRWSSVRPAVDENEVRALRALGYLD